MIKRHAIAAFLALGGLAALPACTMNHGQYGAVAAAPAPAPEVAPGMVMHVQTALQQQGLYKGNIDGVWGPATQNAVMGYQQAHGLTANGQLDQSTLASLNLPAGSATAPMQPALGTAPPAMTTGSAAPMQPAPMQPAAGAAPPATTTGSAALPMQPAAGAAPPAAPAQ